MYVVGLTGGIGSGKSTVSAMLAARGAVVLDADAIVHELQEPGTETFDEIVTAFGDSIVSADGTLDRPKLAAMIFGDAEQKKALEAITHPRVGRRMAERLAELDPTDSIVVLDVPLMTEAADGSRRFAQTIVVVDASPESQLSHLDAKGVSRDDALARMAAQASREERLKIADHVITNDGTITDLEAQVDSVWNELRRAAFEGEK